MTVGATPGSGPDRSTVARLAAAALAAGDPTGWFEELYTEAANGTASIPWGSDRPSATLVSWFEGRAAGSGRALVIGCGYGRDAEFVSVQGYETAAFDISPTAVDAARARHPGSAVRYEVADLLALPPQWVGTFDLVVESNTVQALPVALHATATAAIRPLVAHGGTLLVLGAVPETDEPADGPPWALSRDEVEAFAGTQLVAVSVEVVVPAPDVIRWRAEFSRPA